MHVLIVTQYFWPENFLINDLAFDLKHRGHEVSVLTGQPNYPRGRIYEGYGWPARRSEQVRGVRITRVPIFARRAGRHLHLVLNYLSFLLSASLLGPLFCRERHDVIFVFQPSPFTVGIPAVILGGIKKIPVLFWVQDLWPESLSATGAVRSGWLLKLVSRMVGFVYRRCDRILVQSRGFARSATRHGAEAEKIVYFPNWANDFYKPVQNPDLPAPLAERFKGFCIVFAGNLGQAQSLETIVQAAFRLREIPEIQWIMIGDGRQNDWLNDRIRMLGLESSLHLAGRYPPEVMPDCFAKADALLVTLRRDPVFALTIPSKVQSYLACGRPIVAALDGEGANIIHESGAGLAVDAEDSEALAQAILQLYRMSPDEREAMGERARNYYNAHFKRKRLIDQLENLISETTRQTLCGS